MSAHGSDDTARAARARRVVGQVVDPELPMLTLAALGVLRSVTVDDDGAVVVELTPTYSGCPAMDAMKADVERRLRSEGFDDVSVRTVLTPAWTTDDISAEGRAALAAHGIAPPGPAPRGDRGVLVTLTERPRPVACPRCGGSATVEVSRFGPTPCTGLRRCDACGEPFEHVKEI